MHVSRIRAIRETGRVVAELAAQGEHRSESYYEDAFEVARAIRQSLASDRGVRDIVRGVVCRWDRGCG